MNKSPVEEILQQEKGSVLIIAGEVDPIIRKCGYFGTGG